MIENKPFKPDWIVHPCETIAEAIQDRELSQAEFAARMGISKKHANDLVKGRATITPETAASLAAVLGSTAQFWLNLQAGYEAEKLRFAREKVLEEEHGDWLKELPIKQMVRWGWMHDFVTRGARIEEALRFFGVATVPAWREQYEARLVAFRTSEKHANKVGPTAAWLRKGEVDAVQLACKPWNASGFKALLPSLRVLTREADIGKALAKLQAACAEVGVATSLVRAPKGCRASGATFFLHSDKAVLLLSGRFLSDDQLWFSFFHEAGHLVLHGKKRLFLEGAGMSGEEEDEANRFAADLLIPREHASRLAMLKSPAQVNAFAKEVGIAPGIVVGRMQKEGLLGWGQMNELKVKYEWEGEEG